MLFPGLIFGDVEVWLIIVLSVVHFAIVVCHFIVLVGCLLERSKVICLNLFK